MKKKKKKLKNHSTFVCSAFARNALVENFHWVELDFINDEEKTNIQTG